MAGAPRMTIALIAAATASTDSQWTTARV